MRIDNPIDITSSPAIIAVIIMIAISFLVPCMCWFIRNFLRIVFNRNAEWLSQNLKWIFLVGFIAFLISLLFLILIITGVIK
ncbi:MAG: hypothetical protein ACRDAW_00265 [Metamycoplasmataceae bacterium]